VFVDGVRERPQNAPLRSGVAADLVAADLSGDAFDVQTAGTQRLNVSATGVWAATAGSATCAAGVTLTAASTTKTGDAYASALVVKSTTLDAPNVLDVAARLANTVNGDAVTLWDYRLDGASHFRAYAPPPRGGADSRSRSRSRSLLLCYLVLDSEDRIVRGRGRGRGLRDGARVRLLHPSPFLYTATRKKDPRPPSQGPAGLQAPARLGVRADGEVHETAAGPAVFAQFDPGDGDEVEPGCPARAYCVGQ